MRPKQFEFKIKQKHVPLFSRDNEYFSDVTRYIINAMVYIYDVYSVFLIKI